MCFSETLVDVYVHISIICVGINNILCTIAVQCYAVAHRGVLKHLKHPLVSTPAKIANKARSQIGLR